MELQVNTMTSNASWHLKPISKLDHGKQFNKTAERYFVMLEHKFYSVNTINTKRYILSKFAFWCIQNNTNQPQELTSDSVKNFHSHYLRLTTLKLSTKRLHLTIVKLFLRWLFQQKITFNDLSIHLILPKPMKQLPVNVLTENEARAIIKQVNITTTTGLRNRAILELFYSTGIRRLELLRLNKGDIDFHNKQLNIKSGKGNKDRIIPISKKALKWLRRYQQRYSNSNDTLFATSTGRALTASNLNKLIRRYFELAQIKKPGSCHIFRHTLATIMLNNGADIRFIQQMLGHASLQTTALYTHVSIKQLKKVYKKTAPK